MNKNFKKINPRFPFIRTSREGAEVTLQCGVSELK